MTLAYSIFIKQKNLNIHGQLIRLMSREGPEQSLMPLIVESTAHMFF